MKKIVKLLLASAVLLMLLGMVRGEYRQKQTEIQSELQRLNPRTNSDITYLDFLTYRVLQNNHANIAMLGSSVTKGVGASSPEFSWRALLQKEIRQASRPLQHITIANHGHSGYSSVMLLRNDILFNVIKGKPDLLILETSVINNYRQSVSLEDTKSSLEQLYSTFTRQIPGVEILFISPNPILKNNLNSSGLNSLGLTFEDYVDFTEQISRENAWNYFDTHGQISKELGNRNFEVKDALSDMIHPNDLGYQIWADKLLSESLKKPISTHH
ncbi:SGNH/GDSL hydrolase family protein [Jeotgalibacillus soli]|uniref:SGNH hydrolase-type esterase domain-containing protein n=1 Tax=Jeotgalibacillus soli TaxID=889306 RepID=A0A0C2VYX1_9BACL|nr:SGNH/GDSL hydrolase family protein [Jeotgalibacillus soli]KIL49586.1 hypothetical protein KP78_10540 [Jeotgalibacillus soli]